MQRGGDHSWRASVKILITGSTGLLGQALCSHLARSCDVTGLSRSAPRGPTAYQHLACDLVDAQRTAKLIQTLTPEIVIHTQALSDVDQCERQPETAQAQIVETTRHVIQALQPLKNIGDVSIFSGAKIETSPLLIQPLVVSISTDYVFDGTKGAPYDETDSPKPISVYGRAKLEAEQVVLSYPRSVVVRTSTLFGPGRENFCDHAVSRMKAGQQVEAFIDQVTSPTYTIDLAEGIGELSVALWRSRGSRASRVYHIANAGACSRVTFAERIADLLGYSHALIRKISMAQQRRPAPRPAYSALGTAHLSCVIGRTLRPWDDALQAYLGQ